MVVRRLFRNTSSVGCPRFCMSQARVCARGLSWYGGTVKVGLHSSLALLVVVEQQLDLTSVTARLRAVEVCPGVGTIVFVFQWWYLVVVGRILNATALVVAFLLPLFGSTSACAPRVVHGAELADVGNGKATVT
ncbi:hypothetical protein Taro_041499 [Colocasia esculenta]|uniref:Uncharacterized protein n=1 Tax=Colocasia esculenta TaxID=4460 RepID=A0A843WW24_COLES|nr:hypothetical protein [Colocasia esculenta]